MVFKLLWLTITAVCLVSAAPQSRITGGEEVDITEVPYIAALVYHYPSADIFIQRCVGPLISSYHILSSAYCFTGAIVENFIIRAGSNDSLAGGVTSTIQQLIKHPGYVESPRQNDIAIIFSKDPFRISNVVGNLLLPPQNYALGADISGVVAGWGFDKEPADGGTQFENVRKVELKRVSQETCATAFSNVTEVDITNTVFCAAESDKGICFGDAGAPFVSTVFSTEALVGISSYYQECGTYPDVFTRIDQYSNWILETAAAPSARSALEGDTPKIAY